MINLHQIASFAQEKDAEPAIVHKNQSLSWQQLQTQTESYVTYLINHYKETLPRQVCYIAKNRIDLFPWLAAFATLSIPVVGLDYTLPLKTLQTMAKKIEADFILLSSSTLGLHDDLPEFGHSHFSGGKLFDLDAPSLAVIGAIGANLDPHVLPTARPFSSVSFTSGTSGIPKAVRRTRAFEQRRFRYFIERYGFNSADRFMVSMPLFHAAGNGWARLFLSVGATLYLSDSGGTKEMAQILDQHEITATVFSPVQLAGVLEHRLQRDLAPPSTLRFVLVGGRNFTAVEKLHAQQLLGPVIYEYYGTTESGVNTIAEPQDLRDFPHSVGRAYDGNRIAIISTTGDVLTHGEVGTVCIASYMNMDDYMDGGATFVTLAEGESYFVTPDQGYLDADRRLFLLNRAGDNGVQTPLYPLENALRSLPCIHDLAFLLEDGLVKCAFTTRKASSDIHRLQQRIFQMAESENIHLMQCHRVAEIPYLPSGKVRVRDLENMLAPK